MTHARRVPALLALLALTSAALGTASACERKAIPPRTSTTAGGAGTAEEDPSALLEGGTLVFSDDFEREDLGDDWTTEHEGWRIVDGELGSTAAENEGLWLADELPEHARIEFDARSLPLPGGKPFPGDIKAEVFAEEPEHEGGYVIINGGWNNRLDVIARKDEHGTDRRERPAAEVEPGKTYRWAIARRDGTLYWFRDGELQMRYPDANPVRGRYFGFNNWRTNVRYDDLAVYRLD
ncbi:MAG: hypothetical protein ACQEXJ_08250 [Myxococcota bacterium]